jgi:hypothetical protein
MRCTDCQAVIEDYFDGELDAQTTNLVAQHLAACASCASLCDKLEDEQELYLRYQYDAQPAPDFWNKVLARTAATRAAQPSSSVLGRWLGDVVGRFNAPRLSPSLAALLVLVAIGATIGVMRYLNPQQERVAPLIASQKNTAVETMPAPNDMVRPEEASSPAEVSGKGSEREANEALPPPPPPTLKNRAERKDRRPLVAGHEQNVRANLKAGGAGRPPTSDELVREAEQKYVAAIEMLSRDINRRRSRLDAETAARFAQTLAAVDRTIIDTRRAARKHPGDPVAAQYMLTAYAKKVDVLREIIGY